MMMMLVVLVLCLISSAGAGYYYTTQGKEEDGTLSGVVEDEFKAKYQEAMLALEKEKALVKGLEDSKVELSAAEQRLADAKAAFGAGEFDNDAMRNAALARVQEAESDVETSRNRVTEAENKADRAAIEREIAEKNAASALEVAVSQGTKLIQEATDAAEANLVAAQGRLAVVRQEAQAAIEKAQGEIAVIEAQAASEQKILRDNAAERLAAAITDAERAAVERENDRLDREWAEEKEAEIKRLGGLITDAEGELETAEAAVTTANGQLATAKQQLEAAEKAKADALLEADRITGEATTAAAATVAAAAAAEAALATPNLTTSTGGPHSGGIIWQSHDIGGRFHSPGGLVWLGDDGRNRAGGHGEWNQKYKFRCEKNGAVSPFSPTYGPVNFRTYHNPKIQVSDAGKTPCVPGFKLQVWDANLNTDITPSMKSFDTNSAYDGTDYRFYDPRTGIAPKGCAGYWDTSSCGTRKDGRRTVKTGNQVWRVTEPATAGGACPHSVGATKGC
jgi:hypothetical protein